MVMARIEPVFLPRGAIVLLEGEPGIGKTRLLQEIQRDLEWRGAQVIWSKVSQVQSTQVEDLLVQAIKAGLSPLRIEQIRCLASPEQRGLLEEIFVHLAWPGEPPAAAGAIFTREGRRMFARGLASVLSLWSQVTPLVLVLDDFHWAGEDAWETLVDLMEPMYFEKPVGVGFLISMRPEEAKSQPWIGAALGRLSETGCLTHMPLRPLDREASSELIRTFLGIQHPFAPVEMRLYQETGGNPLFVLESMRLLYAQGRLYREMDGGWQFETEASSAAPGGRAVSPMVESALARRMELLSPATRRVLQTLAVLGDSTDFLNECFYHLFWFHFVTSIVGKY
jgi:predicted ATPase